MTRWARRHRTVSGVSAAVAALIVVGVALPAVIAWTDPAMSALERERVIGDARAGLLDNPFQRILVLTYRVERVPAEPTIVCDEWLGKTEVPKGTSWHVAGYGPFGIRIGGGIITCDGGSSVDGV